MAWDGRDPFPPHVPLESTSVLRALVAAYGSLAKLKGAAKTMPNEGGWLEMRMSEQMWGPRHEPGYGTSHP